MASVRRRRIAVVAWVLALAVFLGYRMVRPLSIFVVTDEFARPIPVTEPPTGLLSISAAACGQCHSAIYDEWSRSMHAQAWTDPYFQVDFAFDRSQQVCLNCHTPMQNQQRNLVLGFRDAERLDPILTPNEKFDPGFQAEGVTCAVCHVKDGAIVGPYGDARAPHPTRQDSAMTKGFGVCQRCHVVSGSRWDTFYRIPPCGTVAEIQEAGATPDCTGCHMPEVTRPLWAGGPPRAGRQHLWRGGHTPASVQQALSVDVDLRARPDGRRVATVTLTNVGADHYLPTGTPDRHLTLELELRSAEGRVLLRREHALERVILWRPIIVDLWDTRLPAKEPRTYELEFPVDAATSPATLDVRVRYHLLGEARRKRIGYENLEPISYLIYEQRVPVSAEAGN